jgi:hypothetical protein
MNTSEEIQEKRKREAKKDRKKEGTKRIKQETTEEGKGKEEVKEERNIGRGEARKDE